MPNENYKNKAVYGYPIVKIDKINLTSDMSVHYKQNEIYSGITLTLPEFKKRFHHPCHPLVAFHLRKNTVFFHKNDGSWSWTTWDINV